MTDGPFPMRGKVRVWDPPYVLEFFWSNAHAPESVVRYELHRSGSGTLVQFSHRGIPYASSALMLPGWHNYFAVLGTLLNDTAADPEKDAWRRLQSLYVNQYELTDVTLEP